MTLEKVLVGWLEEAHREICCKVCICPKVKAKHQNQGGLPQEIQVQTWKWEDINIDIVVGFPQTQKQYDSILVIVDRLTKSGHFIPVWSNYSAEDYARIFIVEIVYRHGILLSVISDRGAQFTSRFWRSFQKGLCSKVQLSTAFHHQMDGQADRTIQTL